MAKNPTTEPETQRTQSEERPAESTPPRTGSGSGRVALTLLLLFAMVVASASTAVLAAVFIIRPAAEVKPVEQPAPPAESEGPPAPAEFTLKDDLIVNVYQTQQRRYLSVKPVFVLENKDGLKELESKKVELQHLMIGILKGKTLEQLDDPQAANAIGREIAEAANEQLGLTAKVKRVYFTQFVVQ